MDEALLTQKLTTMLGKMTLRAITAEHQREELIKAVQLAEKYATNEYIRSNMRKALGTVAPTVV